MPDFCENCKYFIIENKRLIGINENIPKDDKPSDYIPQYKCKLGHKISKSSDGWVPFTHGYVCKDFIAK